MVPPHCGGGPIDFSLSHLFKSFFFPFLLDFLFDLGVCWDLDLDQGLTIQERVCKRIYDFIFAGEEKRTMVLRTMVLLMIVLVVTSQVSRKKI